MPRLAPNPARPSNKPQNCSTRTTPTSSRSAGICGNSNLLKASIPAGCAVRAWCASPVSDPLFDEASYEQGGHIRIDFGNDAPFLEEEAELNSVAARHMEENVRQLVELTSGVEKASGATARLLWSELGESLAQRLAARLGQRN